MSHTTITGTTDQVHCATMTKEEDPRVRLCQMRHLIIQSDACSFYQLQIMNTVWSWSDSSWSTFILHSWPGPIRRFGLGRSELFRRHPL